MPTLAPMNSSWPSIAKGCSRDSWIRAAMPLDLVGALGVLDQDGELVPAKAGHGVRCAHPLVQPRGHLAQQLVAGGVPERVVHGLEVVEVHEQDGDPAPVAAGPRHGVAHAVLEQGPVGQRREGIVERLVAQLVLEDRAFTDVADGHHQALNRRIVGQVQPAGLDVHGPARVVQRAPAVGLVAVIVLVDGAHGIGQHAAVLGVGQVGQGRSGDRIVLVAQHPLHGGGRVPDRQRVGVDDHDQVGRVTHQGVETALAPVGVLGVAARPEAAQQQRDQDDRAEQRPQQDLGGTVLGPLGGGSGAVAEGARGGLERGQRGLCPARVGAVAAAGQGPVERPVGGGGLIRQVRRKITVSRAAGECSRLRQHALAKPCQLARPSATAGAEVGPGLERHPVHGRGDLLALGGAARRTGGLFVRRAHVLRPRTGPSGSPARGSGPATSRRRRRLRPVGSGWPLAARNRGGERGARARRKRA